MAIAQELLDQLIADYKKPEDLIGENGLLKQLTKALLERAMQAEMTDHLGYPRNAPEGKNRGNSRNGSYKKKLNGDFGQIDVAVPRDRNGSFAPVIVPKGESRFKGFDDKIISMYARGMTTRDIPESPGGDLRGGGFSDPDLPDNRGGCGRGPALAEPAAGRGLPIVYLDAVRVGVRHNGQIVKKAVSLAIAVR